MPQRRGRPVQPARRRRRLTVVALVVAVLIAVVWGSAWPKERRQAEGREGTIVTIGVDARVTDRGRAGAYEISTPVGRASVSGDADPGDRFAVKDGEAYAVGGHTWLYHLLAAILAAIASVALAARLVRLRRADALGPPATSHG